MGCKEGTLYRDEKIKMYLFSVQRSGVPCVCVWTSEGSHKYSIFRQAENLLDKDNIFVILPPQSGFENKQLRCD